MKCKTMYCIVDVNLIYNNSYYNMGNGKYSSFNHCGGRKMGGRYGTEVVMEHRIIKKFEKAGATSKSRAVSFAEAKLDEQEQCWLDYFAGVFLGKIKKTENHLYYI
jgi:hypothetical protein